MQQDRALKPWRPPKGYGDNFQLAKRMGWRVGAANFVDPGAGPLVQNGKRIGLRKVSPSQLKLIQQVIEVGDMHDLGMGAGNSNSRVAVRNLISILKEHPRDAYTEYALSVNCRRIGDRTGAVKWYRASLNDAPVVLARRIEYDDGRPLANFKPLYEGMALVGATLTFGTLKGTTLTPTYPFETDANGCYYVPAWPEEMGSCSIGWGKTHPDLAYAGPSSSFIPLAKVTLLPPYVVRDRVKWAGVLSSYNDQNKPKTVQGAFIDLSWKPYPKAAYYRVDLSAENYVGTGYAPKVIFEQVTHDTGLRVSIHRLSFEPTGRISGEAEVEAFDSRGLPIIGTSHLFFRKIDQ